MSYFMPDGRKHFKVELQREVESQNGEIETEK